LGDGAYRGHTGDQCVIDAATDERSHRSGAAANQHRFYFQTFSGKEAKFLGDDERQGPAQRRSIRSEIDGLCGGGLGTAAKCN
jgi:hypothetical protein